MKVYLAARYSRRRELVGYRDWIRLDGARWRIPLDAFHPRLLVVSLFAVLILAGFTLPYLFVLRPELLLLTLDGSAVDPVKVVVSVLVAVTGIVALAAGIAGWLRGWLDQPLRVASLVAAALLLWPAPPGQLVAWNHGVGFVLFVALAAMKRPAPAE